MIIDLVYVILLCIFLFRGYRRGLIIALFSAIALIVGVLGALKLSGTFANILVHESPSIARWAPLITYIAIFFLLVGLIRLGARVLQKSLEIVALGFFNRLAGAVLYAFLISFIYSGLLWICFKMQLFRPETIAGSKIFPLLEPLAPKLVSFIGKLIPFAQTLFGDLNHFFDQLNQKLPGYVGAS
jgi:membrane protein required for colicin V production